MFRGDAGGWNDNFGGGHQGIVVETPCQKQSASSAVRTTEVTSLSRSRRSGRDNLQSGYGRKAEDGGYLQAVSKFINGQHLIPEE